MKNWNPKYLAIIAVTVSSNKNLLRQFIFRHWLPFENYLEGDSYKS